MAPLPTVMTKKTIERLGSNVNEKTAGAVSDFARKQLEKYGWKEGQGLGKKEDGIVEHLKINKKQDDGGVGIEAVQKEKREQTNVWWHDAFAGALGTINVGKKDKKSKKKRKAQDEDQEEVKQSPPSFDELFKATGGARLGMRARRKQKGKLDRAESKLSEEESQRVEKEDKEEEEVQEQPKKKKIKKMKQNEEESKTDTMDNNNSNVEKEDLKKKNRKKMKQLEEDTKSGGQAIMIMQISELDQTIKEKKEKKKNSKKKKK